METDNKTRGLRGGEFLIRESGTDSIFIPEEFIEEQQMMASAAREFLEQKVFPVLDRIDNLEEGLMPSLLEQAGELGLLAVTVPENFGGLGKDFVTGMLVTEVLGAGHSFAVAIAAHTGIGTLPVLYYGNEDQKAKYLPKLATGEWKACYCLTEPGSGSDANSGKTRAVPEGENYIVNGQKMWITNGGFADIFTVFAKIEKDETLSAFIIEKGFGGIDLNPEEKKMGIKGSSTRQVFFNNCPVPKQNLLGEREEGFKIALNILNVGRVKLAGAALGAAKEVIRKSVRYANEREQFGRPISKYGAIRYKLAEQAIRTFALESALYRCSHDIENQIRDLEAGGMDHGKAMLEGIRQFAAEAALLKVYGSEVLDYVVDEGVQIYGGMGYSAEAPMERAYRDSRINRIFEGTNEINRMLVVEMLLRKAMKGELDLMGPAMKVASELMSVPTMAEEGEGTFARERNMLVSFKKAILMVAGSAAQKLATSLAKEQEVLMNLADMLIDVYAAESLLIRTEKLESTGHEKFGLGAEEMVRVFFSDASQRISKAGRDAIMSFAEGDEQRMMLMGLKRFTKDTPLNVKEARRKIAASMIGANDYCF